MTPLLRIRLRITGSVQGVGFRWFIREHARRLGLAGYVRNEPGGAVLLEAEGPIDLVEKLRSAASIGPDTADVDTVEELEAEETPLPRPFNLER